MKVKKINIAIDYISDAYVLSSDVSNRTQHFESVRVSHYDNDLITTFLLVSVYFGVFFMMMDI